MTLKRAVILVLLPPSWRERHWAELEDMLSAGSWRLPDVADAVLLGLRLRTEQFRRSDAMRALLGMLLVGVGVAGALWSASELTNGLRDVHEHWWSTAAVAPGVVGLLLLVARGGNRSRPA
jgi:hypothetical protein